VQPARRGATDARLRSYVICEICGRRLYGKTRRVGDVYSYYACEPQPAHHEGKDWFDTAPRACGCVRTSCWSWSAAFTRRIFGPDRAELLAGQNDAPAADDGTTTRVAAVHGRLKELERQQANVVTELREYQSTGDQELDQQWRGQLRDSFAELAGKRKALQAQLAQLAERIPSKAAADPRLLDQLPVIDTDLGRLPEDLERELYGGFQLQVRYHHPSRRVTLRVTIDGAAIPQLTATGRAIMADRPTEASRSGTEPRNAESRPTTVSAVEGRDGFPCRVCTRRVPYNMGTPCDRRWYDVCAGGRCVAAAVTGLIMLWSGMPVFPNPGGTPACPTAIEAEDKHEAELRVAGGMGRMISDLPVAQRRSGWLRGSASTGMVSAAGLICGARRRRRRSLGRLDLCAGGSVVAEPADEQPFSAEREDVEGEAGQVAEVVALAWAEHRERQACVVGLQSAVVLVELSVDRPPSQSGVELYAQADQCRADPLLAGC
jgi:hypothetical protein